MKIFITGATGFIGQSLLQKILSEYKNKIDTIYILTRNISKLSNNNIIKILPGTLNQIENYTKELLASNFVYHIAANASFAQKDINYDLVNHRPTVQIIDILKNSSNLQKFIFISSIGAFDRSVFDNCLSPISTDYQPNPRSNYGRSKFDSEKYLVSSGLPYSIIRPAWVWGENMRTDSHLKVLAHMVVTKKIVSHFNFSGKVSLIHVDDLAAALAQLIIDSKKNTVYFAATESISIGEIFKIFKLDYSYSDLMIPLPSLGLILRKIHHLLPVQLVSLFLDYLHCDTTNFIKNFNLEKNKTFSMYSKEISTWFNKKNYTVITGANSGIGYELALKLISKKLILIDKDISNIEGRFQPPHICHKLDLAEEYQINNLAEELQAFRIDTLINNAGVGFRGGVVDLNLKQIQSTINVNILGSLYLTKMLIQNLNKTRGQILNVVSSVAYNPLPFMSIYAASKSFLLNWSEALAYEHKEITTITFCPSGTKTNFQINANVAVKNNGRGLLSAGVVADKILLALKINKSKTILLGANSNILIFICRFLPRNLVTKIWGGLFNANR